MRRIEARAPVRVCDAGGWTDTWFAGHGVVCSVAVEPGAHVTIDVSDDHGPITLDVALSGERYAVPLDGDAPGRHPLLEQAVRDTRPLVDRAMTVRVDAALPPGCGVGTSATVVVALLAALRAASDRETVLDPRALATAAHRVETGLGLQSGVQDQLAAAFGGANEIVMDEYPRARVTPIALDEHVQRALDARLVTIYLGRSHVSSTLHEYVIAELEHDRQRDTKLEPLRAAACAATAALRAADLDAFGAALVANTHAQAALHPELVGRDAREIIDIAKRHGASGWKVNGSGGDGGSVTVLAPVDAGARHAFEAAIASVPRWRPLPLRFAPAGVTVDVDVC